MARLGQGPTANESSDGINTAASNDEQPVNQPVSNDNNQLSLPVESATPSVITTVRDQSHRVSTATGAFARQGVPLRSMATRLVRDQDDEMENTPRENQAVNTGFNFSQGQAGGSALSRFLAEQGPRVTPTVNPYDDAAQADEPTQVRRSLRERVMASNPTRGEAESYRRGLLFANRWLLSGIDSRWDDLHGQDRGDSLLGPRATQAEREFRDYKQHLAVDVADIHPHSRRRFTAYAEEHLLRLRFSGISLSSLISNATYFDVPYLRRHSDSAYIQWWCSPQFRELSDAMDNIPPSSTQRVSAAVLGVYVTLCEHDGVPWKRYLLEVSSDTVDESILESPPYRQVAPPPVHYTTVNDHDVLVIKRNLQSATGSFLGFTCVRTPIREELRCYTPETWRRQERRNRHRYERFILGFQCETDLLHRGGIMSQYAELPRWWAEVEVPYGFLPESPRMLYYLGLKESIPRRHVWDVFLQSEWAMCCATHLMYEARAGRLWWLPYELRCDIRTLGISDLSFLPDQQETRYTTYNREVELIQNLRKLLEYIDMIAWDRIPSNGIIPEYPNLGDGFFCTGGAKPVGRIGAYTPVHRSADWVVFDPERWCLQLPDKYFVEFSHAETGDYDPEHPRLGRVYDRSDSRYYTSVAEEEWRSRTLGRLQRDGNAMDTSTIQPNPGPSAGRIRRSRARTRSFESNPLLEQFQREGITDVNTLITRLRGDSSGAGPSGA